MNYLRAFLMSEAPGSVEESLVDDFVDLLLYQLGFHLSPLHRHNKRSKSFKINGLEFELNPDIMFSIEKRIVMIVENNHYNSKNIFPSNLYGECQHLSQHVCAAFNNFWFNDIENNGSQTLFGMKIVGKYFIFYKTTIPNKYIISLSDGFPTEAIFYERFPDINTNLMSKESGLDFTKPNERRIILSTLLKIKYLIKQNN